MASYLGKTEIALVDSTLLNGYRYIDDEDAYPGMPFTRYFADLIGSGTNVPWDDVL